MPCAGKNGVQFTKLKCLYGERDWCTSCVSIKSIYGMMLLIFNLSDFVPHWILMVLFVWTYVIVQGLLLPQLSVLWRILFFLQQYFVTRLIVPVNMSRVLPSCVVVCLLLSVFPYFCPVGKVWDIKQHVLTKDCRTWWQGSEYCVVGRVNGPCAVCEKVS